MINLITDHQPPKKGLSFFDGGPSSQTFEVVGQGDAVTGVGEIVKAGYVNVVVGVEVGTTEPLLSFGYRVGDGVLVCGEPVSGIVGIFSSDLLFSDKFTFDSLVIKSLRQCGL